MLLMATQPDSLVMHVCACMHSIEQTAACKQGQKWCIITSELALASDFDTQHAVATAAALIHLGLCAVP